MDKKVLFFSIICRYYMSKIKEDSSLFSDEK
jgi:hypothetical protein